MFLNSSQIKKTIMTLTTKTPKNLLIPKYCKASNVSVDSLKNYDKNEKTMNF